MTRFVPPTVLLLAVAAQGCSYLGSARDFDPDDLREEPGWVSVGRMELQRQETREDCGIAAMGMVLRHYGRPVAPAEIERACPVEGNSGSRAGDMRDLARKHGLQAYLIRGEFCDLEREVARKHPLIVGLVKQYSSGAVTHYEVVVAIHPERGRIVTLDPANGWRCNTRDGSLGEWEPAQRLLLVVLPPGDPSP